jgi:predicted Zn finger-like uncharacterized protein
VIIACQQCHTRFKVPDGKVTARGLKVRCSRCHHTFRIFPDSASDHGTEATAAAPRPTGPDPFQAFGPDGTSDMEKTPARGTTVSALLAQMAPPAASEDFDVDVSGEESGSTEPAWNFPPAPARPSRSGGAAAVALQKAEPRQQASEPPGPHSVEMARQTDASLGSSSERVPVAVQPLPPAAAAPTVSDSSFAARGADFSVGSPPGRLLPPPPSIRELSDTTFADLSFPSLGSPSGRAPVPVRPLPPEPPAREVADISGADTAGARQSVGLMDEVSGPPVPAPPAVSSPEDLAALAGFTPAWGLAPPTRALSVDGSLSDHVASLAPGAEPQAPAPPPPQFGGGGTVLDDLPSLEAPGTGPIPELELDSGGDARDWAGAPPTGDGGVQLELESAAGPLELDRRPAPEPLELDRRPEPEPLPAPPQDPAWSLLAPPASPAPPAAPHAGPGLSWDDPFAGPPPPLPPPAPPPPPEPAIASPRTSAPMSVVLDEAPSAAALSADHDFFDMPAASPAPEPSSALLPDIPEAVEPPAAGSSPRGVTAPLPAISKPPRRARLGLQEREEYGTARRVSAVVLNVGLAALLLLVVVGLASSWATAGRLEGAALSPRRLLQALRPGSGVSPVEVTPGTYETSSGRSLLYVRGRVLNRGVPSARVRVRAEVWDGAQAVKAGETLAGAIATPEELWRAATPADVEALRGRLLSAATPVADGHQADFLVLLDDAPADLSGLRLRVTASVER